MSDMNAETALPRISQPEVSKGTNSKGKFHEIRSRVSSMFSRNKETSTQTTTIAGREVPEFPNGNIEPMQWPERPQGFPRDTEKLEANVEAKINNPKQDDSEHGLPVIGVNVGVPDSEKREPVIGVDIGVPNPSSEPGREEPEPKVIHETEDGPVINATGKEEPSMNQQLEAIKELVPEGDRKRIEKALNKIFNTDLKADPIEEILKEEDPTNRELFLREFAAELALRQLSNNGRGGVISPKVREPKERQIYENYKIRVFPPVKRAS
ncbi:MAG: hypothetical protein ACM3IJ_05110 [Candidatus Levyibacteriota bacterium]